MPIDFMQELNAPWSPDTVRTELEFAIDNSCKKRAKKIYLKRILDHLFNNEPLHVSTAIVIASLGLDETLNELLDERYKKIADFQELNQKVNEVKTKVPQKKRNNSVNQREDRVIRKRRILRRRSVSPLTGKERR